jgi:osmotically-inducible protein OsmY
LTVHLISESFQEEMGDPKSESRNSTGTRRDDSRGRERNNPESRDRRSGHSDRYEFGLGLLLLFICNC